MNTSFRMIAATALTAIIGLAATAQAQDVKPTIVLVHGAFLGSDSWNPVAAKLTADGYTVVSAPNPMRGLSNDAKATAALTANIKGKFVLVGNSYGGMVITSAAAGNTNVKALVYVGAFSPEKGESAGALIGKFSGSSLGTALFPIALPDGGKDLYITPAKYHPQFAADVTDAQAGLMAIAQRPITEAAIAEPLAEDPAWKTVPSWHIYGSEDKVLPPMTMAFMAKRANAKKTIEIPGGSHVIHVSHPEEVAKIIEDAASSK